MSSSLEITVPCPKFRKHFQHLVFTSVAACGEKVQMVGTGGVSFLVVLDWKLMCRQHPEGWQRSTQGMGNSELLESLHSGTAGHMELAP